MHSIVQRLSIRAYDGTELVEDERESGLVLVFVDSSPSLGDMQRSGKKVCSLSIADESRRTRNIRVRNTAEVGR